MPDYKTMYAVLCKAIDEEIESLQRIPIARPSARALQAALLEAEKIYIDTAVEEAD